MSILLVEDSQADALILRHFLDKQNHGHRTHWVQDGEEAIHYLHRDPGFENSPKPDLVLLDINLPKVDGWEVLRQIKCNRALRDTPVLILTSSTHPDDVRKGYALQANSYIVKPGDLDRFEQTVRDITGFWLRTAVLPKSEEDA